MRSLYDRRAATSEEAKTCGPGVPVVHDDAAGDASVQYRYRGHIGVEMTVKEASWYV
jgi:hypothetical protein